MFTIKRAGNNVEPALYWYSMLYFGTEYDILPKDAAGLSQESRFCPTSKFVANGTTFTRAVCNPAVASNPAGGPPLYIRYIRPRTSTTNYIVHETTAVFPDPHFNALTWTPGALNQEFVFVSGHAVANHYDFFSLNTLLYIGATTIEDGMVVPPFFMPIDTPGPITKHDFSPHIDQMLTYYCIGHRGTRLTAKYHPSNPTLFICGQTIPGASATSTDEWRFLLATPADLTLVYMLHWPTNHIAVQSGTTVVMVNTASIPDPSNPPAFHRWRVKVADDPVDGMHGLGGFLGIQNESAMPNGQKYWIHPHENGVDVVCRPPSADVNSSHGFDFLPANVYPYNL